MFYFVSLSVYVGENYFIEQVLKGFSVFLHKIIEDSFHIISWIFTWNFCETCADDKIITYFSSVDVHESDEILGK